MADGDTLWTLAAKHLGDGRLWWVLWKVNRAVIDRAAERLPAHMRAEKGPCWIWPGMKLYLPATEKTDGPA